MQNEGLLLRRPSLFPTRDSGSWINQSCESLVIDFRCGRQNCAARCVDVIVILPATLLEVDVVVHDCAIEVEFNFESDDVSCGEAGICKCDIQGCLIADVGVRGRRCGACCRGAGRCSGRGSCCGAGWRCARGSCSGAGCSSACGGGRVRGCGARRSCRVGCCSTAGGCLRTTASRQAQARCQRCCCDECDNLLVQHFLPSLFVVYRLVRAKRNTKGILIQLQ